MSAKAMRNLLADDGEHTASENSFIEHPIAERVRRRLGLPTPPPPPTWEEELVTPRHMRSTDNPTPTPTGLTPPKPQIPRNNNPVMPEARRPRDDVPYRLTRRESEERQRARSSRHTTATPPPPRAGFGTRDCSPAMADASWTVYGLTRSEREQWTAAGLRDTQAHDAAHLKEAGITPADLDYCLDGWTILERLTKGEGAAALARRIPTDRD